MARGTVSSNADNRVTGLRNLGNTCYFSAVMQSLLRTDLLREELQHHPNRQASYDQPHQQKHQQQQPPESSRTALTDAFLSFSDENCKDRSGNVLAQLIDVFRRKSTRFSGGGQHDSHDCLIHFLNALRDEERSCSTEPDPKKCLTAVDKVFGGHLVTDYTCLSCGDQHRSCEPLLTISLPVVCSKEQRPLKDIRGNKKWKGKIEGTSKPLALPMETTHHKFHRVKTSMKRCFKQFTRFEEIENEYLCHRCQSKEGDPQTKWRDSPNLTSAIKCTLIYNPPAVLVLHMKRFEQVLGRFRKRNDKIRYKELLNLGPYCISGCKRNNPRNQNIWYSLFGVIVHKGSLTRGHYVAYVKDRTTDVQDKTRAFLQTTFLDRNAESTKKEIQEKEEKRTTTEIPSRGQWFYVSDQHVRRLTNPKEAMNKEAYLLFYERIGTPLPTTGEHIMNARLSKQVA